MTDQTRSENKLKFLAVINQAVTSANQKQSVTLTHTQIAEISETVLQGLVGRAESVEGMFDIDLDGDEQAMVVALNWL